jgi:hypothetical protein
LARLARVRRKLRDPEAALRAYNQLLQIPNVAVAGMPGGLVARHGRAGVFQETGRSGGSA